MDSGVTEASPAVGRASVSRAVWRRTGDARAADAPAQFAGDHFQDHQPRRAQAIDVAGGERGSGHRVKIEHADGEAGFARQEVGPELAGAGLPAGRVVRGKGVAEHNDVIVHGGDSGAGRGRGVREGRREQRLTIAPAEPVLGIAAKPGEITHRRVRGEQDHEEADQPAQHEAQQCQVETPVLRWRHSVGHRIRTGNRGRR
jgi:hypothetical protein